MNADIKAELVKIMDANDGQLRPDDVIAAARSEESPLHGLFEWDQGKAALEHWRDTARQLIRSVRVVITNETTVVRAPYFVRDPSIPAHDQGYVALTSIRSESEQAREVLVDEMSRAASALRRAKEVAKVLKMEDQIVPLIDGVLDLRARIPA